MDITIKVQQETVDTLGIEFITERLNRRADELDSQVVDQKKRELGEKMYVVKDTPEAVAVLAQADIEIAKQQVDEPVDNTQTDVPVADITTINNIKQ